MYKGLLRGGNKPGGVVSYVGVLFPIPFAAPSIAAAVVYTVRDMMP